MNKKKSSLIIILIAIFLSIIVGLYIKENTLIFFIIDLISRLFINFLLFLLIPLICSAIISSIIKLKKEKQKKGLVLRIFGFFLLTNFAAIIVGFFITLLYPTFFKFSFANSYSIDLSSFKMFGDIMIQIIPNNIIHAFANNQMLGVIFFSIIFGYVSTKIKDEFSDVLFKIFDSIFHAMLEIANIVIKVLPLGIFCLLVKHIATIGYSDLYNFIILMGLVLIALFFYCFIVLFGFFKIFVKVNFFAHLKKIMPAIIVGFFTTSSASTLSVLMKCLKNKNKNYNSIVLPLGISLNMAGSVLYIFMISSFILQTKGIPVGIVINIFLIFLSLIISMGIAAIPSGALLSIIIIIKIFGLSTEDIAMFFAIDRIIDMFRTAVNIITVSASASFVNEKYSI